MKVLVTGSRNLTDYGLMKGAVLDADPDVIIHGGARGADKLAGEVAFQKGITCRVYPAKWDTYGRSAGPKRNQEMLDKEHTKDEPIDLVLAFPLPGSIGTYDMINRAKKAGIEVKVYGDEHKRP